MPRARFLPGMEVAYFLQFHHNNARQHKVPLAQAVNPFENLPVMVVSGWRF